MFKQSLAIFLLAAAMASPSQASTVNIDADGSWNAFDVDDLIATSGGLEWIDLNGDALTFSFTLTQAAVLDVVDAGFGGDRFSIAITGPNNFSLQSLTSTSNNTFPDSLGLDFDQAFLSPDYSRLSVTLAAGTYSIAGALFESALDDSGFAINATVGALRLTSVPLPAAAWLYLTGAFVVRTFSRRKA